MYCSINVFGNGVVNDETGNVFGILLEFINGWHNIWSNVNLFDGSTINILEIRFLALCDTLI